MRRCTIIFTTSVGLASMPIGAPMASAFAVAIKAPLPVAAAVVQWDMRVVNNSVTDVVSGLDLELEGRWSALNGAVSFGGSGAPSIGVSNDRGLLSPGSDDFAVAVSLTTQRIPTGSSYSPNVVQKGLAGGGGQWKVELHPNTKWGVIAGCRFEGDQGSVLVRDTFHTRLDDAQQHVVACWRMGKTLGVTVDGRDRSLKRSVGVINPRAGVTVANKGISGGVEDQLQGSIGCIMFIKGLNAKESALSSAGC